MGVTGAITVEDSNSRLAVGCSVCWQRGNVVCYVTQDVARTTCMRSSPSTLWWLYVMHLTLPPVCVCLCVY